MANPMPTTAAGWLQEVVDGLEQTQAEAEGGLDAAIDAERWRFAAERAVLLALAARQEDRADRGPVDMDAVTDVTVELRRLAPGDPNDVHLNDVQHFLLYYLAAHVHAGHLPLLAAGVVATDCWNAADDVGAAAEAADQNADAEDDAGDDEDEDKDDRTGDPGGGDDVDAEDAEDAEDGEPWPISRRPPGSLDAWADEIVLAYQQTDEPPPLITEDGQAFVPGDGGLLESGVILCLHNRGARIPVEAVFGLIGVIEDMVKDIRSMGPEWQSMQQVPPLAFTIYYVWAHIVIGHLSEDLAMDVVKRCTDQLDRFPDRQDTKPRADKRKR
ncbi:MAG: hypothetical protein H0V44_01805 [Planctomycetes bacterium]|nr:hypothetical protein [Planctomycetota bacterium]